MRNSVVSARKLGLMLFAGVALAVPTHAQFGFQDLSFPNTSGQGSSTLRARVYYPSNGQGRNAPILPRNGGYPTVVYLHGFLTLGREYPAIGEACARAGYVCVLNDTARFDRNVQRADGRALFPALGVATRGSGPLSGAIDTQRIGLFGYSMGGGNTLEVLAANPGYASGLAIAAVRAANLDRISVPLAFLHGDGDTIVPASTSSNSYGAATGYRGFKTFYRLGRDATHTNVASLLLTRAVDREVWARCSRYLLAFFDRTLREDPSALERVLGQDARAEARLTSLQSDFRVPEVWQRSAARTGARYELGLANESGFAALFLAAPAQAPVSTPFGALLLDPPSLVFVTATAVPSTKFARTYLEIPQDPRLVGLRFAVQSLGRAANASTAGSLRLSALAPNTAVTAN